MFEVLAAQVKVMHSLCDAMSAGAGIRNVAGLEDALGAQALAAFRTAEAVGLQWELFETLRSEGFFQIYEVWAAIGEFVTHYDPAGR